MTPEQESEIKQLLGEAFSLTHRAKIIANGGRGMEQTMYAQVLATLAVQKTTHAQVIATIASMESKKQNGEEG